MPSFRKTENNRQNYSFVYRNLRVFKEHTIGRNMTGLKMVIYPHNLKLNICTQLTTQRSTQPQPAQPVQNTICSNKRSCSPDDGLNDVRSILR